MHNIRRVFLVLVLAIFSHAAHADSASLLLQAKAANPVNYQFAVTNGAELRNTSDNKAFTLWWQATSGTPSGVIVTLHGHGSYATDEFYLWLPYAQARGYAILAVQWWFGGGEATSDYYAPQDMYSIIETLLKEKGVVPGTVLLHVFSRGSANSYGVTALAGGAASDFAINQQIVAGTYGALPLSGVSWMMYCGELDPDPTKSGCPAMKESTCDAHLARRPIPTPDMP